MDGLFEAGGCRRGWDSYLYSYLYAYPHTHPHTPPQPPTSIPNPPRLAKPARRGYSATHLPRVRIPHPMSTELRTVHWWHDRIIDKMLTGECLHQGQLAAEMGYSENWISIMVNSDAFQERLRERQAETVDPVIRATLETRLKGLSALSAEIIARKLEATNDANLALRALDISQRALSYTQKPQTAIQINQTQYVAVVPAKSISSGDWVSEHFPPTNPPKEPPAPLTDG